MMAGVMGSPQVTRYCSVVVFHVEEGYNTWREMSDIRFHLYDPSQQIRSQIIAGHLTERRTGGQCAQDVYQVNIKGARRKLKDSRADPNAFHTQQHSGWLDEVSMRQHDPFG